MDDDWWEKGVDRGSKFTRLSPQDLEQCTWSCPYCSLSGLDSDYCATGWLLVMQVKTSRRYEEYFGCRTTWLINTLGCIELTVEKKQDKMRQTHTAQKKIRLMAAGIFCADVECLEDKNWQTCLDQSVCNTSTQYKHVSNVKNKHLFPLSILTHFLWV